MSGMRYWLYIDADGKEIIERLSGGMKGAIEVSQAVYDTAHPPVVTPVSEVGKLISLLVAKGVITAAEID